MRINKPLPAPDFPRESKYKVQLRAGGKVHFIGTYAHLGETTAAADAARDRLHGEFANKARSR